MGAASRQPHKGGGGEGMETPTSPRRTAVRPEQAGSTLANPLPGVYDPLGGADALQCPSSRGDVTAAAVGKPMTE